MAFFAKTKVHPGVPADSGRSTEPLEVRDFECLTRLFTD
jgi:hypothetical protein